MTKLLGKLRCNALVFLKKHRCCALRYQISDDLHLGSSAVFLSTEVLLLFCIRNSRNAIHTVTSTCMFCLIIYFFRYNGKNFTDSSYWFCGVGHYHSSSWQLGTIIMSHLEYSEYQIRAKLPLSDALISVTSNLSLPVWATGTACGEEEISSA